MAHELTTRADGLVEFAYRADHGLPWHGLGQEIPAQHFADVDAWRVAAGMDWKVQRGKVRYAVDAQGTLKTDEENHVLFRSDTKARLGIVSAKYKVVQPRECLELFRDAARIGGVELSAAGTLQGGRRFWATAKVAEGFITSRADAMKLFLLFTSSADGSLRTTVGRKSTRVVCANTLAAAMAEGPAELTISHRSVYDATSVREFMQLNVSAWDQFRAQVLRLANRPVLPSEAPELTLAILNPSAAKQGGEAADKVRESAGFKKVLELFNGAGKGSRLDGVFGTRWGLVNAFTEYVDHHARAHNEENRLLSAQWGQGNDLKSHAMAVLSA